ncbi:hypothetical protein GN958_ATG03710 [Phytophthora infestans]|uniref:Uncharacterized protein n=1 Tax=Phytophthora infestans TaxID=4787 RepID=A0A8S9V2L7_PHYIN|nr:hypothetical protein GN958_ATG03710 [Phytophthora infestans]
MPRSSSCSTEKGKEAKGTARKRLTDAERKKRKPDTVATAKQPNKRRTYPSEEQDADDNCTTEMLYNMFS